MNTLERESMQQTVAWVNGRPTTRAQLSVAFDMVADPDNWKNPIRTYADFSDEEVELVREAVVFFTGSVPQFKPMNAPSKPPRKYYLVTAAGYRDTVGA